MAKIAINRTHSKDVAEVMDAVRSMLNQFQTDNPGLVKSIDWNGDGSSAVANGKGFKARFSVTDTSIDVNVDLSLLASALKGRIESSLSSRLDDIL